jgi:CRISPR-associated endonuclease/helicase Cas3
MAVKIDDRGWVPATLRAKSVEKGATESHVQTLQGHTMAVLEATNTLLDYRGESSLTAVGLDSAQWLGSLRRVVSLAAAVHDLGKASIHFQRMVWNGKREQLIRHEALLWWISAPGSALYRWLLGAVKHEWELVAAMAVASGHHRKFTNSSVRIDAGLGTRVSVFLDHPDFAKLLRAVGRQLDVAAPPPSLGRLEVDASIPERQWSMSSEHVGLHIDDAAKRRLVAVSKSLLISADIAGSALPRSEEKLPWLRTLFGRARDGCELRAVIEKKLAGKPLRAFQCSVRDQRSDVTLVRAGCGTGKTLAAYAWAERQHPDRTLWLTYPTTGTAAEGYRGYLDELTKDKKIDARLESGRASVDYEIFGLYGEGEEAREVDRLDALRIWGEDVVACTVDTVLGLLQHHRKGHYAWPSLCRSAVVFDEVHAYDDVLFATLIRWVREVPGVPVLMMTASLPADRLATLDAAVRQRAGRSLHVVDGPREIEELPRYLIEDADDALLDRVVVEAVGSGKKVLWVSNTVNRCIEAAQRVSAKLATEPQLDHVQDAPVLVYHSRFRYEDRVERHRDVVAAFEPEATGGVVACTTQVAEMSLDLSADLLVMDLAPVPAMIQRLGRLNRRAVPADAGSPPPPVMTALVRPFTGLPYGDTELAVAQKWLNDLPERALSQRDLTDWWKDDPRPLGDVRAVRWLDAPFETQAGEVRQATPGITVLRDEDKAAVRSRKSLAVRYAIPMNLPPAGVDWRSWEQAGWLPVAPKSGRGSLQYDAKLGARWHTTPAREAVHRPSAMAKPKAAKPAPPTSLVVDLDMPGMTPLLAAGVGGLAASLYAIARQAALATGAEPQLDTIVVGPGTARVEARRVLLEWPPGTEKEFFEALCSASFRIDRDGIIDLPGAWGESGPPSLSVRSVMQDALRYTFLQHGSAAQRDGAPQLMPEPREEGERPLMVRVQRHSSFNHQGGAALILEALRRGEVAAAGWVYPGAITRHEGFKNDTECGYNAAELIAGLFAIVGAPSFRVGDRPIGAILVVVPADLRRFAKERRWFSPTALADTSVSSAADAALRAWLTQRLRRVDTFPSVASISAMALKKLPWADKQKGRFRVVELADVDDPMLTRLEAALGDLPRLLRTQVVEVEGVTQDDERQGFWLRVSEFRGFVTENIAAGRRWFEGFATARTQDDPPRFLHRFRQAGRNDLGALRREEVEGVRRMIEAELRPSEARLIEAIHDAMRRRFNTIYQENKTNPEARRNRRIRQRDRWRLSFTNARTASDVRRAVTDLVGRESTNSTLQQSWREITALLKDASQWELVRDLSLIALVSYLPRSREEGAEGEATAASEPTEPASDTETAAD